MRLPIILSVLSVIVTIRAVRRAAPCPSYDSMHTAGGTIPPCEYAPLIVYNHTIGDNEDFAFTVDGTHLASQGAVAYLKSKYGLSPDQFVKCSSPDCSELGATR